MSRERKSHQRSVRFYGPIVNLTSDVSLMHMHVQNLFCNDNSVTHFSYSKLTFLTTFLTRNSLFKLETHFSYSKLAFLTRNSLFLLETRFSYSKLIFNSKSTFLTRNSLFLLETHFSYSKLTFLNRTLGKYCQQGNLASASLREHVDSAGHNENDKLFIH